MSGARSPPQINSSFSRIQRLVIQSDLEGLNTSVGVIATLVVVVYLIIGHVVD